MIKLLDKLILRLLLWLFILAAILFPTPIQAQRSDLDLGVQPAATYLDIEPGKTKKFQVSISHNGTTPLDVITQVVEFTTDGQTGIPRLDMDTTINFITIKDEDSLPSTTFKLLPHTKKQLTVVVSPPLDVVQKEYHLSVLFTAKAATTETNNGPKSGSQTSAILASNLIAFVSSEEIGGGPLTISQIKAPSIFDSLMPLVFRVNAKNEGRKAAPVKGRVRILNWLNQEIKSFPLATDIVLSDSSRNLSYLVNGTNSAELATQTETSVQSDIFTYDRPFLLGPLTIEAVLESNSEPVNTMMVQKRVLALPISIFCVILLAILFYVMVLYLRRHKYILQSLKKSFNLNNKLISSD